MTGPEPIPRFTAVRKAAGRLLVAAPAREPSDAVLDRAVRDGVRERRVPPAAVDGTGMGSRHVGRYCVKRRAGSGEGARETTHPEYPKVVLVTDCRSHLVLAATPGQGPGSGLVQFEVALEAAAGRARIGTLLADAGHEAEWVREHVRDMASAPRSRRRGGGRRRGRRPGSGDGG